jgi:signal transduction histidine kinase
MPNRLDPLDAARSVARTERVLACFRKALGHDLSNQLVAVQGLIQVLRLEEGQHLSPEGRDYLERLAAAARRAQALVGELAEVCRTVQASDAPAGAAASLAEAAREAAAEVNQLSPGHAVEYDMAKAERRLPLPYADLRQVLVGLLRQAAHRAPAERPLNVEVGARETDAGVEFWVRDDGPALSPAAQQRLFEPFAGGALGETEPVLGLFLASLIVDTWGGTIRIESEPERGTTFIVVVPRS